METIQHHHLHTSGNAKIFAQQTALSTAEMHATGNELYLYLPNWPLCFINSSITPYAIVVAGGISRITLESFILLPFSPTET